MFKERWRSYDLSAANLSSIPDPRSIVFNVATYLLQDIDCKPFLLHNAPSCPRIVLYNAYKVEEKVYRKHVKHVRNH